MQTTESTTAIPAIRISIGMKIFGVATSLLLLMATVALVSLYRINQVNTEIVDISSYDIPFNEFVTTIERLALRQEVQLEGIFRLYAAGQQDTTALQEKIATFRKLGEQVDEQSKTALRLTKQGQQWAGFESDRLELASLQVWLQTIERTHQDFEDLGSRIIGLLAQGKAEIAAQLQEVMADEREELNALTAMVLKELEGFTKQSVQDAQQHESYVLWFNLVLTLVATGFGLLGALLLTMKLVRPVRQLVLGTHTIQQGDLDVTIQVTSGDEIGLLTSSFNQMTQELKLKERIKETFGKYIDPRIVDDLLQHPDTLQQDGQRRVMTVLFCDIEGFTSLGEWLTPQALVTLINRYLTLVSQPIQDSNGVIDKYIGDAVMAFWGPPFTGIEEHARAACLAALEMFDCVEALRHTLPDVLGVRKDIPSFRIRIGLATGDVIVGNIGSDVAKSYTVMGDTVNLASRLEGVNKAYQTRLLISAETQAMAADVIETREIDTIQVVGKSEPVRIFEVLARKGALSPQMADARAHFAQGLEAYRQRDWDSAQQHFEDCLTIHPHDGPAAVFLERLEQLRQYPAIQDWDGVWILSHK